MSLFGAAKKTTTFQKAKERLNKMMAESSGTEQTVSSSGVGKQLEILGRGLPDPDGTATSSEVAQELEQVRREDEQEGQPPAITLPRALFNQRVRIHNREAIEVGHLSQIMEPALSEAKVDQYGNRLSQQHEVYTITSDDSSSLSPPPTTSYGGSSILFPEKTQSTKYEGSLKAFPPSAMPEDPFETPRQSGSGILATRYIQSEENISKYAAESKEEEGVLETPKRGHTPTFENSDSDDAMTEVRWREEEPYMMSTKSGN